MTVRIFLKKLSSEDGRKFIRSASKIVHERNGHRDILSHLLAIEISRQYFAPVNRYVAQHSWLVLCASYTQIFV